MEKTTFKSKWANWKLIALVIILIAIFVKFFVIGDGDENAPVTVEVDLPKVAMRSQEEVEAVLGKGKLDSYYKDDKAGCEKCPKMTYKEGKIDIIYINDIADRITINDLADFDFEDRVILGLLNLKNNTKPVLSNGEVKRWDNYEKYSQIAAFAKKGKTEYILIKTKTL
jgi:hypothetical protein